MKQIICLTKEDINCQPYGLNFVIGVESPIQISLTREACEELKNDLQNFLNQPKEAVGELLI